jgi:hypothetical protein
MSVRPFRLRLVPLLLVASVMAFGLISALGCKAVPQGTLAAGWRSTPELTGPAVDVGLGQYELKSPFASDAPPVDQKAQAASTAELKGTEDAIAAKAAAAKADADAKAAAAAAAPAQVAAGTLSEADAKKISDAADMAVAANKHAVELQASFTALSTKYHDLDAKATALEQQIEAEKPGFLPKSFDLKGVIALATAWGLWLVHRNGAKTARAEAEQAKNDAIAAGKKGLADFDALPDSVKLLPDGSVAPL